MFLRHNTDMMNIYIRYSRVFVEKCLTRKQDLHTNSVEKHDKYEINIKFIMKAGQTDQCACSHHNIF